jgi:response regulator RpfG family c-di-GMP phosphodiesterase
MGGAADRVLIVDDDVKVVDMLESLLTGEGYQCQTVLSGEAASNLLVCETFDLVLTDIRMPGKTGVDLLREIMASDSDTAVVLMTGLGNVGNAVEAMKIGAADYIEKPIFDFDHLLIRIGRALERQRLIIESRRYKAQLEEYNQRLEEEVRKQIQRIRENYLATLDVLITALGFHDTETKGHSRRVAEYTRLIAQRMGLDGSALDEIEKGALLHDVGKVGVPDAIIRKPGKLTEEEWEKIREHPAIGCNLLAKHEFLRGATPVVKYHHERYDGTGYPAGLAGEEIPIEARIFAVVDAFDVITSDRPYKKARPIHEARSEINRCAGAHFDPQVVDVFNQITDTEFWGIRNRVEIQFGA